ncbi:hypothetical protein [Anaeromicropila populeti]|uniref:FtsX-like permease family protein n=1 Tax=Anaeromicropila populeti TaxID=37658 RepID=A0A1I6LK08_9FIRM|nr:hypothetical protein [Anaeromicropila populeti]SFS03630.1 hypothetical protein SAMN05661086_03329 [Anaeromicropila populeti]
MNQIEYACRAIANSKRTFICFVIQLIVIIYLMTVAFTDLKILYSGIKKMEGLKSVDFYVATDSTTDERISRMFSNEDNSVIGLKTLLDKIYSYDDMNGYTVFGYDLSIPANGGVINEKVASKNFFDTFHIGAYKGRLFSNEDFTSNNDVIPVVIGFNLRNQYKIGQEYKFSHGGTGMQYRGIVVGILDYNSCYPDLYYIGINNNLNNSFFFPMSDGFINKCFSLSDFHMAIDSTVLITDNLSNIKSIEKFGNNIDLLNISYKMYKEFMSDYINHVLPQIMYEFMVASIIFIFAVSGMSASLSLYIRKNVKNYAIHLICGARISDLVKQLFYQIFMAMLIPMMFSVYFFGFGEKFIYSIIISTLIIILTAVLPVKLLYTCKISQLTRRDE